jgi:hypothetical protein
MNNQRVLLHFVYILLISERDFVIHVYMWTEKVYITPSPMGVRLHKPPTYETVYITP